MDPMGSIRAVFFCACVLCFVSCVLYLELFDSLLEKQLSTDLKRAAPFPLFWARGKPLSRHPSNFIDSEIG